MSLSISLDLADVSFITFIVYFVYDFIININIQPCWTTALPECFNILQDVRSYMAAV